MKEAKIKVTVQTYFEDHTYRNNTVELTIPVEAAKIISDAWAGEEMPQREAIKAMYLAKNQLAHAVLTIDGRDMGGMRYMDSQEKQEDTFTYRFGDDEDDE